MGSGHSAKSVGVLDSTESIAKNGFHPIRGAEVCASSRKLTTRSRNGGADRVRTDDLRLAKPALSQLSYSPIDATRQAHMVGLGRFELPTSRLSGVRSNQLSYRPAGHERPSTAFIGFEHIDAHRSLAGDRPSLVPSNRSQLAIHSGSVPKN